MSALSLSLCSRCARAHGHAFPCANAQALKLAFHARCAHWATLGLTHARLLNARVLNARAPAGSARAGCYALAATIFAVSLVRDYLYVALHRPVALPSLAPIALPCPHSLPSPCPALTPSRRPALPSLAPIALPSLPPVALPCPHSLPYPALTPARRPVLVSRPALSRFVEAMEAQPTWPALQTPTVEYVSYGLFVVANVLVLSSMWVLGITGTYLGDYFGILMTSRVTGFPFNVMENPMYNGATLNFLGLALRYAHRPESNPERQSSHIPPLVPAAHPFPLFHARFPYSISTLAFPARFHACFPCSLSPLVVAADQVCEPSRPLPHRRGLCHLPGRPAV